MTEEAPQRFDIRRWWQFLHGLYLCFVHLYPSLGDNMSENNSFFHHEMTLLPIKHKINLSTSFKNFLQICQEIFKVCFSPSRSKVIIPFPTSRIAFTNLRKGFPRIMLSCSSSLALITKKSVGIFYPLWQHLDF